jgi:hypothetical protein
MRKEEIEEVNEKFEKLWKLTREQDKLQLGISAINQSIADGLSFIDHANAIILESSLWKGNIVPMLTHGYLAEKIKALNRDLEWAEKHYEMRETNPDIFRNLDFDFKLNRWKLKEKLKTVI